MINIDTTQKLIIRIENADGTAQEASYTDANGLNDNEVFWMWFLASWEALGCTFIKNGADERL